MRARYIPHKNTRTPPVYCAACGHDAPLFFPDEDGRPRCLDCTLDLPSWRAKRRGTRTTGGGSPTIRGGDLGSARSSQASRVCATFPMPLSASRRRGRSAATLRFWSGGTETAPSTARRASCPHWRATLGRAHRR